ncbi:elongation factor Ts [Pelagibacterales bacterium SAG-MED32]|nr:elongation factor Ts [Pelagibacterales bacterium SAG-MED32]|tara:strand:+ start:607 stop:1434 length:828 start_codon:yes stop_codon:yes gene_type:complete
MTVSAKEVQELRKISGAGMMECKSALSDANGNLDQAFKLLREKGIAKAEKKSLRDANEGLVAIKKEGNSAVMIKINSETDFVSRNAEFHELVNSILEIVMKNKNDTDKSIEETKTLISDAVGKIGENIVLKSLKFLEGNIYSYIHNSVTEGMGKIGVLINFNLDSSEIENVGKNICMHIAASSPKSLTVDDLDKSIIENEKEIISKQLKETGKPENILEKMMEGKLNKFYEENTLMGQKFVMDPSISIEQYLKQASKEINSQINIQEFLRFEIGS